MIVHEIKDFILWDKMVLESDIGSIFLTSYWINKSTKYFKILGLFDNNKLLGGVVFQYNNIKDNGGLSSITPYLGFVFSKDFYLVELKKQKKYKKFFINHLNNNFNEITFFSLPFFQDLHFIVNNNFDAKLNYTNIIDLEKSDDIYSSFSPNTKRNIASILKTKHYIKREYNTFNIINLIKKSFERQSLETWFDIQEAELCFNSLLINNYGAIFTTFNHNNLPIASVGIAWDKNCAYYIIGGYDYDLKHRGGTSLAMYEAIKFIKDKQIRYFDFEGSRNQNIDKFFSGFNGKIYPFYLIQASNNIFEGINIC
jgi:hypothetical protein